MSLKRHEEILLHDARHVWHPFTQAKTAEPPIVVKSASGSVLKTEDGRELVDLISSWWVNVFGHAHPDISKAISDQASQLEQVIFAGFTHEPAATLAAELARILPGDLNRVFFSDDGSTAVEVAIKAAFQYWRNGNQSKKSRLMAFDGGYHGDTFGAMAAGRGSGFFEHWGDLLFHVDQIPFPATWEDDETAQEKETTTLAQVRRHLESHARETFAMILEPLVQGAGGMRMTRPSFVKSLVELLREFEVLVIFDEVMTGFGRTGSSFACEQIGVVPDLICLSKGLTGGFLPLSVTVARDGIYDAFLDDSFDRAFAHGHSFTANPLGCAAALASIKLLESEETKANLKRIYHGHVAGIEDLKHNSKVVQPRILGTIGAVNAVVPDEGYQSAAAPKMKKWFLENGMLIRPLGNVLYLLPPYCTTDDQLKQGWEAIAEAIERFC